VTLIETDQPTTEPTRTRNRHLWPIITVAAAAVVLIVGGALVFAARDDATDQATVVADAASEEAERVARGFLDAYVANDADRAITYLSDAALDEAFGGAEELRLQLSFNQTQPYRQTIGDCEQHDLSGAGIDLRCSFTFHAISSDELGFGPYTGNYWDLTVSDGAIVSVEENGDTMNNGFSRQMWEPFASWIRTTHPEDVAVMYDDETTTSYQLTEESIRLWGERVREYVTTQAAFIARADAICAAAHDRLNVELRAAGIEIESELPAYRDAAARILDEAVVELRSAPAPEAFRAEFDSGYSLVEQLAGALRGTGTRQADLVDQIRGLPLGLTRCTFSLPGE
jgi:hypothetical protein